MSLDAIRHKLAHIQNAATGEELAALRLELAAAGCRILAEGGSPTLELDLLYAVLRHRRWLGSGVARAVLIAFLVDEHGLAESESLSLVAAAMATLKPAAATDADFLRHVVVHCLTAADARAAALDLGIGEALLGRIKRVLHAPTQSASPPLDDAVLRVVSKLAAQLADDPDTLDMWRLGDHLHAIEVTSDETALRAIFEALLRLGIAGELTGSVLTEGMPAPSVVVEALQRAHLIETATTSPRVTKAGGRWRLAALGADLTAEAFARRYCAATDGTPPVVTSLGRFCGAYQAAVLRGADDEIVTPPLLRAMLAPSAATPAAVVRAAARRLTMLDTSDSLDDMEVVLAADASPWRRISICQGIGGATVRPAVGQLLGRVAKSDPSPLVREAALAAMLALEQPLAGDSAEDETLPRG